MPESFSNSALLADPNSSGHAVDLPLTSPSEAPTRHEFWQMLCYYYNSQGPVIFLGLTVGVLVITCLKWTLENAPRGRHSAPKEIISR